MHQINLNRQLIGRRWIFKLIYSKEFETIGTFVQSALLHKVRLAYLLTLCIKLRNVTANTIQLYNKIKKKCTNAMHVHHAVDLLHTDIYCQTVSVKQFVLLYQLQKINIVSFFSTRTCWTKCNFVSTRQTFGCYNDAFYKLKYRIFFCVSS